MMYVLVVLLAVALGMVVNYWRKVTNERFDEDDGDRPDRPDFWDDPDLSPYGGFDQIPSGSDSGLTRQADDQGQCDCDVPVCASTGDWWTRRSYAGYKYETIT